MLAETRSTNEVRKIRAVAPLERGKEIAIDAADIILQADARIGELTREMPTEQTSGLRKEAGRPLFPRETTGRPQLSKAEGLSRNQAA
jgi:hypothetical protein